MIKAGDIIKFKPEWRDPGDDEFEFFAMEDEDGGRVLIGVRGVLKNFTPCQVVDVSMIEQGDA